MWYYPKFTFLSNKVAPSNGFFVKSYIWQNALFIYKKFSISSSTSNLGIPKRAKMADDYNNINNIYYLKSAISKNAQSAVQ